MKSFVVSFVLFLSLFANREVNSYVFGVINQEAINGAYADVPPVCHVGLVAYLPDIVKPPIACVDPNEIYVCAYGEGRCDGRLFCGTPPCTWRCWCKSPYKRDANGKCVLNCPFKAEISIQTSPL